MKLRKDQRYTLYCILLEEAENLLMYRKMGGFCGLISDVTGLFPTTYYARISEYEIPFKDIAPELLMYKNNRLYWFENWGERIKALKQCIKETENF